MTVIPLRMSVEFARTALEDLRRLHAANRLPGAVTVLMLRLEDAVNEATRPRHAPNEVDVPQVSGRICQGLEATCGGVHDD